MKPILIQMKADARSHPGQEAYIIGTKEYDVPGTDYTKTFYLVIFGDNTIEEFPLSEFSTTE